MARPTLVLLPGLLNTRRVFEHQISALSDVADVVVPELWHHDSVGAMAEAALALAPGRFALGGFSMGGYVAFEMLRRAAERVERLALIDTQATPDAAEATARRRGLIEQTKIGRFHGVHRTLLPLIVHPSHLDDPAITQPILDMSLEIGAEGFVREQTAIIGRPDSRPLLVDIEVPTVVIVGRQDQTTPLGRSEEMAADISTSRLVVLEDCGHMTPLERPAEVTAALRRWLSA
ncbi:MAG: alpha/beta hydrolase [Alphaproteobacteria bacterium RIFCSPHIGHO2_12_FULL_66_14]|nr:MAG: alpha/beta hydrolase [Alphaproteobacteria bacterium RIFCSPHIGHO2_12_FULL_66_14]